MCCGIFARKSYEIYIQNLSDSLNVSVEEYIEYIYERFNNNIEEFNSLCGEKDRLIEEIDKLLKKSKKGFENLLDFGKQLLEHLAICFGRIR